MKTLIAAILGFAIMYVAFYGHDFPYDPHNPPPSISCDGYGCDEDPVGNVPTTLPVVEMMPGTCPDPKTIRGRFTCVEKP